MVPKAGALAPPGIGEPIAPICVDDPGARVPGDGPRAGVPMVDIPCAKPGPAPSNALMAATTHMRRNDPIEVADGPLRFASHSTVSWTFVIARSKQRG